ncbi:MAG: Na+/H+ antiporter [Chloroflexi bacterium]|nr:Na+/H+ antiporter [Chloroflexota bacterium]MCI0579027.1 Na+/H+ antiporter [Chloroflexota bacterium]MCI0646954.1 Na+/H+ antiporter [Chloroflexota bacterium]MCI0730012.1 Na+/H+ antiporter [Chloroflexota bacterium]
MDFATLFWLQEVEESPLIQVELAFVILLSVAAGVAILTRRIRLPYTVALVLMGLALSFVPNPFEIELSSEIILALLVPPLIFEATLNLKWEQLRRNLLPVLLLAVAGTLASTFIVAGLVMAMSRALLPGFQMPWLAAVAFGALISATDPVAVLAFFRNLGVGKRLSVLIEGESLFNDGVAIVLFNITIGAAVAMNATGDTTITLGAALAEFLWVSLGGLAVGILLGLVVSYGVLKNVDDHLIETATTVALAYGAFVLAEQLHVSGILAVVAAGLFVGNIGSQNTSPTTKITLDNFWEFLAFVVNSLVFLLIGLETDLLAGRPSLPLILTAVVAVAFSRAVVVYALTGLHSLLDRKGRIPVPFRHVMFWGGLRGAISLALALTISDVVFEPTVAQEVRRMTFGVVLFTLIVQGTIISPLLNRLGLAGRPEQKLQQQRQQALLYAARAGKGELDRLHKEGILPADVWQAMAEVYTEEIRQRDRALRQLLREHPELEQEFVLQGREDVLRAERSAINDAARRGLISEEVYDALIEETDQRAIALELIRSTWGMGSSHYE